MTMKQNKEKFDFKAFGLSLIHIYILSGMVAYIKHTSMNQRGHFIFPIIQ